MNIHIAADQKVRRVSVDNALFSDSMAQGPKHSDTYLVRRNRKTLLIHVQLDSGEKIIRIPPHNSVAFWLNVDNYGIGMLFDKKNPKRYGYRRWNYLRLNDTGITLGRFAPIPKGTMRFTISVPLVNAFSLKSPEGRSTPAGPLGLEAGIDYFYNRDRYLSVSLGAGSSVFVDHIGNGYYNTGHTFFSSIRNNNVIGSFDLGYGLSFSDLLWSKITIGDTINRNRSVRSWGIGPSLSLQYRIGNYFRFGLLYQPTLFSVNGPQSFGYQHYIAAGIAWKWPGR